MSDEATIRQDLLSDSVDSARTRLRPATSAGVFTGTIAELHIRPPVRLLLDGQTGNSLSVVASCHEVWKLVHRELEVAREVWQPAWREIRAEMLANDYDHLLVTVRRYFEPVLLDDD